MEKFRDLRNYEVLNEKPLIKYAERDYGGMLNGEVYRDENMTLFVQYSGVNDKIKEIFKKKCVENELNPKRWVKVEV